MTAAEFGLLDELPPSTVAALQKAGIWTVEELLKVTPQQLCKIRGIRKKDWARIECFLKENGVQLQHPSELERLRIENARLRRIIRELRRASLEIVELTSGGDNDGG